MSNGNTPLDRYIIGANSLVTKDVPPFTIVAGIPARTIRRRFSDEEIDFLEKTKWWDWNSEQIKEMSKYFNDINDLRYHL